MSQADKLLNALTDDEIESYLVNSETEPHIVISEDRFITVPAELKRIAVQYDHNIETVTFDCPRYWDGIDMSEMQIYINYMRSDGEVGSYIVDRENVRVDTTDESIMHFDWVISNQVTYCKGYLSFLVCIKAADSEGRLCNHWNSELNQEMYISEGLEVEESILVSYPDIINQLLTRMYKVEDVAVTIERAEEIANKATAAAETAVSAKDVAVEAQEKTEAAKAVLEDGGEWIFDGGDALEIVQVITVDSAVSADSTNPVENQAITNYVNSRAKNIMGEVNKKISADDLESLLPEVDSEAIADSENAVQNKAMVKYVNDNVAYMVGVVNNLIGYGTSEPTDDLLCSIYVQIEEESTEG